MTEPVLKREFKVRHVTTYFVWAVDEEQAVELSQSMSAEVMGSPSERFHIEVEEAEA